MIATGGREERRGERGGEERCGSYHNRDVAKQGYTRVSCEYANSKYKSTQHKLRLHFVLVSKTNTNANPNAKHTTQHNITYMHPSLVSPFCTQDLFTNVLYVLMFQT